MTHTVLELWRTHKPMTCNFPAIEELTVLLGRQGASNKESNYRSFNKQH